MSNCRVCDQCGRTKDCTPEPLCELCEADVQGFGFLVKGQCETIGCTETEVKMITLGPGTTAELCRTCAYLATKAL